MARISDLPDELLVHILSFLPTRVATSTSILSKQWKFLWMWLPNLEFSLSKRSVRDFLNKNLSLHRAPFIKSLSLHGLKSSVPAENFKSWVEIAVTHSVRELICINYDFNSPEAVLVLPSSLFTCSSLVVLKLQGGMILVDVPGTVCLPSLKSLELKCVTYSKEDSLRLLLTCCPVLEDLRIDRGWYDNLTALDIIIPSLQRLSLSIDEECYSDEKVIIVAPSLKYFNIVENRSDVSFVSYVMEHMPELEEVELHVTQDTDLGIDKLFRSISTVKRLSVRITVNSGNETLYGEGIVFSRLENLKLHICSENWTKILFQLLKDSPNLQMLHLSVDHYDPYYKEYKPGKQILVPKCLLESLKTLKFEGYIEEEEEEEEKDLLSFIYKHGRCLKPASIL